jgi:hypothetical protein
LPAALKVVIVEVGLVGLVMVAVPGLPGIVDHDPVPMAAIVDVPPGRIAQVTVLSGPALGLAVMITATVSLQPLRFVQMK